MRTVAALVTMLGMTVHVSHAETIPLNGGFDTDISGWTYAGYAGGALEWDGTIGSPTPGSLQISGPAAVDGFSYRAMGPCVTTYLGEIWELQAQVHLHVPPSFAHCFVDFRIFPLPDCSGSESIVGELSVPPANQWALSTSVLPVTDYVYSLGRSFRPALVVSGNQDSLCNFDSVRLQRGTFAIPTLHPLGLLVLVVLIASAAIYMIRT